MKFLLDTHAFLWFVLDDSQLSQHAKSLIEDPINDVAISPASYWEIAIKIQLGKFSLPLPYQTFIETQITTNDIEILPVLPKHTALLTTMPLHHKDPFDRLIMAQAMAESLPIISSDGQMDAYAIKRRW